MTDEVALDSDTHLVKMFGKGHASVKTERRGSDVLSGFVCCLLVVLEAVKVLVSFGALLAAVFLLLRDGVDETRV